MRSHLICWAVVVTASLWLAPGVEAQTQDSQANRGGSLVDSLDRFGKNLFGGILGTNKEKATRSPAPKPSSQSYGSGGVATSRVGSAIKPDTQAVAPVARPDAALDQEQPLYRPARSNLTNRTTLTVHPPTSIPAGPAEPATSGASALGSSEILSPASAAPTTSSTPPAAASSPAYSIITGPSSAPTAAPARQETPALTTPSIKTPSVTAESTGSNSAMRLHERLSMFRQPTFNGTASPAATAGSPAGSPASNGLRQPTATDMVTPSTASAATTPMPSLRQPASLSQPTISQPVSQPAVVQPAYSRRFGRASTYGQSASTQAVAEQPASVQPTTGQPTLAPPRSAGQPTLAPSKPAEKAAVRPSITPSQPTLAQPSSVQAMSSKPPMAASSVVPPVAGEPDPTQAAPEKQPAIASPSASANTHSAATTPNPAPTRKASPSRSNVSNATEESLEIRQSPVLGVKTLGPRRITVGKESSYEMILRNSGQAAADQVVVTVGLPEWAEVAGTEASTGETDTASLVQSPRRLVWKVARLDAKGQEKLVLRIIPRQSRPIDLAVTCDYTPLTSQTLIEVQEPRLEMRLDGPREVLYGQRDIYRLELTNSGNGDAEKVEISLLPIGTGDNVPATHQLGTLTAGEKKVVEVELTARQTGSLTIKVDARGEGGLTASLTEAIQVRRAEIQASIEAPPMQFVGTQATYRIRVTNTGTAPATNVQVLARIPLGTKHVSSTGEGKLDANQGELTWKLNSLTPNAEQVYEVVCSLERPGTSRMDVTATADSELTASANASTQVEAMADLRLDVIDPSGPVPVGSDAVYQIEVRNRGSKNAEDVEIVTYFSRGIEPTSAEGGAHRLAPGQVVFDKLATLAAGQTMTFKIHAKATTSGSHVFRAEVFCKPLDTRLVAEETTHYYGGPSATPANVTAQPGDSLLTPQRDDRTADRRDLSPATDTDPASATTPRAAKAPTPAGHGRTPFSSLK
jgi:uncharacterized repeat protein (TIGR01451 family)